MDVVKFLREDPVVFCIVDFELEVWRDALTVSWDWMFLEGGGNWRNFIRCGLDYGEICADYVGGGVGFGLRRELKLSWRSRQERTEIDGPYPSSSCDIEDILWI